MESCGVLLAGGQSSRMGIDKSMLELGGRKVVNWVHDSLKKITDQTVLISNNTAQFSFMDIPAYPDVYQGEGPMAGLHAAITHCSSEFYVLSACDTPFISPAVYEELKEQVLGNEIAIPVHNGKFHPMSGVYSADIHRKVELLLTQGKRSMKALIQEADTVFVDCFPSCTSEELERHFFNMNYPQDYEEARKIIKTMES